jgi:hypothetical protein
MEKISWTDRVRNEEVLQRGKEDRNILQTKTRKKANRIGRILCRYCLLKNVMMGRCKGREDEEEKVSSYWIAWRERQDSGNRKREH